MQVTTNLKTEQLTELSAYQAAYWPGYTLRQKPDDSIPDNHLFVHDFSLQEALIRIYPLQNTLCWCFSQTTPYAIEQAFSFWKRRVSFAVKTMIGAIYTDAVGLDRYAETALATQYNLEPHPLGEPRQAFSDNIEPLDYAGHIASQLQQNGWCY